MKVSSIAKAVAGHFELNLHQLLSGRRTKTYVMARRMCSVLCRELTVLSLQEIAEAMGMGDHTTVDHHLRTHPGFVRDDHKYAANYNEIRMELGLTPEHRLAEPMLRAVK